MAGLARGGSRDGRARRLGALRPALTLALALVLGACAHDTPAPRGGTTHVVRPGETVWRISQRYGVSVETLVRANGIRDVHAVPVGTRLSIPGARAGHAGASAGPDGRAPVEPAAYEPRTERLRVLQESDLAFAWPLQGRLTSRYGRRGRKPHEGIDVAARSGTPVRAAEAGKVIHSGRLGDYGNVVIVKHAGRYSTVYAHNRRNLVAKGQFVERGQVIAEVGRTGNASGPHLHFEVRRDRRPQDPLRYLP